MVSGEQLNVRNLFSCKMKRKNEASTASEGEQPLRKMFRPAIEELAEKKGRTCFVPILAELQEGEDAAQYTSFFGGFTPYFNADEKWPKCGDCDSKMRLFFQIDLSTIPQKLQNRFGDSGLLQFFCCVDAEDSRPCDDSCDHFSSAYWVRIVQRSTAGFKSLKRICAERILESQEKGDLPKEIIPDLRELVENTRLEILRGWPVKPTEDVKKNSFPFRVVTGWQEKQDYPNNMERDTEGAEKEVEKEDGEDWWQNKTVGGCKMGGWANWCQDEDYPDCPQCKAPMRNHVFQLEEDDVVRLMWGDSGTAQILQCNTHKDVLTFGWSCC